MEQPFLYLYFMFEIRKFTTEHNTLFEQALSIRVKVFVDEQQVPLELEADKYEDVSTHYLVFHDQSPIATARWRKTSEGIKIERIAVLIEYRDRKVGSFLLKHLISETSNQMEEIYLYAQVEAIKFYKKYSFITEGETFMLDGIMHIKMVLKRD